MSPGHPELQDFEGSDHDDRDRRGQQAVSRIGEAECQSDQYESERVLSVLAEVGVRPEPGRPQGGEGDGGGQQPGQ
jgi:hypothetical protein